MASHVLKIGSVDLSDYVKVGPEGGLDVYGQAWEDPQFSESPVGEGNPLISEDVGNREMVWPMFLNGASRDALNTLKQRIVRECRYGARPLQVEWREAGAASSTFYTVTYARLDETFRYRLSEQRWADAGLRVWCAPPYGHTGTITLLASAMASNGVLGVPIPSFAGDMEPLVSYQMTYGNAEFSIGSQIGSYSGQIVGLFSVVGGPNASWYVIEPSRMGYIQGGTLISVSGATYQGSTILRMIRNTNGPVQAGQLAHLATMGRTRLLVQARSLTGVPFQVNARTAKFKATAVASPMSQFEWQIMDLGVVDLDARWVATGANSGAFFWDAGPVASSTATATIELMRWYLLPDDSTTFVVERPTKQTATVVSGGTYRVVVDDIIDTAWSDDSVGIHDDGLQFHSLTGGQIGMVPRPKPGLASQSVIMAVLQRSMAKAQTPLQGSVHVRERFTFAR